MRLELGARGQRVAVLVARVALHEAQVAVDSDLETRRLGAAVHSRKVGLDERGVDFFENGAELRAAQIRHPVDTVQLIQRGEIEARRRLARRAGRSKVAGHGAF